MAKTETASDIVALMPSTITIAMPMGRDLAKEVFEAIKADAPSYWALNQETGEINGSSTYLGIDTNRFLRTKGLWLPTPQEGRQLDAHGKLSKGVYRDFGINVYSEDGDQAQLLKQFIDYAKARKWEFPFVLPFRTLGRKGNKIIPTEDNHDVLTGEEAQEFINALDYQNNQDARGLCRYSGGRWGGDVADFAGSGAFGRVDFVCGEATRKNLESDILAEIDRAYQERIKSFTEKRDRAIRSALEILER